MLYKFSFVYSIFLDFQEIFSYCSTISTSQLKELCKDRDSRKRPWCKYFCNFLRCMSHTGGPKIHGKSAPPTLQHFSCAREWKRKALPFFILPILSNWHLVCAIVKILLWDIGFFHLIIQGLFITRNTSIRWFSTHKCIFTHIHKLLIVYINKKNR